MGWNNDFALQLIDEYEKHPILWNAKNENHFSRNKKADAWETTGYNLKVEVCEVKQKLNSLLGSFRRENAKGKKSIGTGKGRHEIYVSKWFAFERMGFLLDKDEPRTTIHTERETEEAEDDLELVNNSQMSQDDESFEIRSPSATQPTQPIDSPAPPKKKSKKNTSDPRLEEAYQTMKASLQAQSPDTFSVYGQHIANKLKTYSKNTQTEVEHAINNILYKADKGFYDRPASSRPQFTDSVPMHYAFVGQNVLTPSSSSTPPYTISTNPTPTPTAQNIDMPDLDYTT